MNVKKYFLVISLVQAASTNPKGGYREYFLTTSLYAESTSTEIIEYNNEDSWKLNCEFDMTGRKPAYIKYNYILFQCVGTRCKGYNVIVSTTEPNSVKHVFLLHKSDNNSIYGCGIIESPIDDPILHRGSKVYVLRFHKPTTKSTTAATSTTVSSAIVTTALPTYHAGGNGGLSPWIWQTILGVFLLLFCAYLGWLIYDRLKKNKRRNVTKDTSAMNYENLVEDRYCLEPSRDTGTQVKEVEIGAVPPNPMDNDDDPNYAQIGNFNNTTYAVPYQRDMLYAKPIPKSERNKKEIYAQVLPENQMKCKTLDKPEQYENHDIEYKTAPLPKPETLKNNRDLDVDTNVSESVEDKRNSIYDVSDKEEACYSNMNTKEQYSNFPTTSQQYVNAEGEDYVEPAYCEIPKYVNKK